MSIDELLSEIPSSALATWNFIDAYFYDHGYMPSQSEIANGRKFSQSLASRHLLQLQKAGALTLRHGGTRDIRMNRRPPGRGTEVPS